MKNSKFRLTVDERLMLHLSSFSVMDDQLEMPFSMTQQGIADAIQVMRSAVPRSIKTLEGKRLVEERLAHVRGASRRRKIYLLTRDGRVLINELIDRIMEEKVKFSDDDGEVQELRIRDLHDKLLRKFPLLEIVSTIKDDGCLSLDELRDPKAAGARAITDGTGTKVPAAEDTAPATANRGAGGLPTATKPSGKLTRVEYLLHAPKVSYFEGRDSEMAEIFARLAGECKVVVIYGIAGMGKTTLAASAMERMRDSRSVFWYRFHEWDSLRNLLLHLGRFLAKAGNNILREFLERNPSTNIGEAMTLLEDTLSKMKVTLFFDDVQKGGDEVLSFFRALIPMIEEAPDIWMVVTSRDSTPFYDRREVLVKKTVHELELPGLDMDASFRILRSRGIEEDSFSQIYHATGGHPLSLELVESVREGVDTTNFTRYMEEEVFSHLEPPQKELLCQASVFRYPVQKDALISFDPDVDHSILSEMIQRTFISKTEDGYELHDILKDFVQESFTHEEMLTYHRNATAFHSASIKGIEEALKDEKNILSEKEFERHAAADRELLAKEARLTLEYLYHLSRSEGTEDVVLALYTNGSLLLENGLSKELMGIIGSMDTKDMNTSSLPYYRSIKALCHHDLGEFSLARKEYEEVIGPVNARGISRLQERFSHDLPTTSRRNISPIYILLRYGVLLERENRVSEAGDTFAVVHQYLKDNGPASDDRGGLCLELQAAGHLGWNLWKQNGSQRSGELFEECLRIARNLPGLPGQARLSMEHYRKAVERGDLDGAMNSMNDFLAVLKKDPWFKEEAAVLGSIEDVLVRSLLTRYTSGHRE